ncbi:MAG: SusC/RagA family TonB-linked outer membrane protein [Muribaculaceae bacterium]|nr:SusC/RagA family TonB-linked outer membrane protein [Muribaculaceae bacterium]
MCGVWLGALAQQSVTYGTVTDENGEPLVGVTVLEQGTTHGTTTDLDGKYRIEGQEGNNLVFSYVGMVAQSYKAINGELNVVLKSADTTLDQLVVVGYGVQKKSDVTGAISKVEGSELENLTVNNPTAALAGKTSGVQVVSTSGAPGAAPTIRVRGYSSNSDMAPLYVVDGIRLSDISGIDPSQIESIEVLKDGASAAIYGAQAGNGVVLITTKSAKKADKGYGHIRYDFQYVNQSIGHRPQMMNSAQYMEYMVEQQSYSADQFAAYGWNGKTDTNWMDVIFGKGDQYKHTFTFEGANDRGSLFASFSYLDNNGPVRGKSDYYKRLSGNINADYQIKPWFKVGTTNIIERWQTRNVSSNDQWGSVMGSVYAMDPLTPAWIAPDMIQNYPLMYSLLLAGQPLLTNANGDYYGVSAFYDGEMANPLILRDQETAKYTGFNVTGSAYALFNPWRPLTITSRFGYRLESQHQSVYDIPYYAASVSNRPNLSLSAQNSTTTYYQWENFANYDQTFNDLHNVTAMAGLSFQKNIYSWTSGSANFNEDSQTPALPVNNQDIWGFLDYVNAGALKGIGGNENVNTQYSWFARVGYNFDNKYMINASIRGDSYDNAYLPLKNRWGYFPSVSLGYMISQEDFMGWSRPALDFLKLRFSWGKNGSVAPLGGFVYSSTIGNFDAGNFGEGQWYSSQWSWSTEGPYQWQAGNGPLTMGNNELTWETMTQWDLGFDAGFFNNRLTLGFDYFHKVTDGLLVYGVVPTLSMGGVASPINAGSVLNEGVEVEIGWNDRVGDFSYSISANVSTLKNKVTKIHPQVPIINGTSFSNVTVTRFEVGEKVWHFYGYDFAGLDPETGTPLYWAMRDGERVKTDSPDENDKTNIGDGIPDVTLGLNINLAYKGFDFLLAGSGTFGNDIFMNIQRQDRLTSNRMTKVFYDDRWSPTNKYASHPNAGLFNDGTAAERYLFSSAQVYNGSFFKIRQIQLGYTIPSKITRKIFVDNFRVYLALDDFITFTKYPGLDPEVSAGTGSSQGLDMGGYPIPKKFTVGFNITF